MKLHLFTQKTNNEIKNVSFTSIKYKLVTKGALFGHGSVITLDKFNQIQKSYVSILKSFFLHFKELTFIVI